MGVRNMYKLLFTVLLLAAIIIQPLLALRLQTFGTKQIGGGTGGGSGSSSGGSGSSMRKSSSGISLGGNNSRNKSGNSSSSSNAGSAGNSSHSGSGSGGANNTIAVSGSGSIAAAGSAMNRPTSTHRAPGEKEAFNIGLIAPHTNFGKRDYLRAINVAIQTLNKLRTTKLPFLAEIGFSAANVHFDMMSLTPSPTSELRIFERVCVFGDVPFHDVGGMQH